MDEIVMVVAAAAGGYLPGSISFARLIARRTAPGVDITQTTIEAPRTKEGGPGFISNAIVYAKRPGHAIDVPDFRRRLRSAALTYGHDDAHLRAHSGYAHREIAEADVSDLRRIAVVGHASRESQGPMPDHRPGSTCPTTNCRSPHRQQLTLRLTWRARREPGARSKPYRLRVWRNESS